MSKINTNVSDTPAVYLRNKRKNLGLTQDEFASLFDMSKDTYRKYEEEERTPSRYVLRMMKIVISYYEKEQMSMNTMATISFLEAARQECLAKYFCKEQHDIVNMVFAYLIGKAEQKEV